MELFRKYKHKNNPTPIFECVAELDNGYYVLVWVYRDRPQSFIVSSKEADHWYVEYIEPPKPIVHERWITWGKYQNEVFCHTSFEKPKYPSTHEILKQEQIYFTEFPEPVQKETKKRSIVNCERDCERRGDCTCS